MASALTTSDVTVLGALARIQAGISAQPSTSDALLDLMKTVNDLSYTRYQTIQSTQVRAWADVLYAALIRSKTNFQDAPVSALLVAFNYMNYLPAHFDGLRGGTWNYDFLIHWHPPLQSPDWNTAVSSALACLKNPVCPYLHAIIKRFPEDINNYYTCEEFERSLFDPKNWTNVDQVKIHLKPLFDTQADLLNTMQKKSSLDQGDCFWLLYALFGAAKSNSTRQQNQANTLASAIAPSTERPNATLAEQLVYFVLMTLLDPLGSFSLTHDQLQTWLKTLAQAAPSQEPGAQLMSKVLGEQLKILTADPSYPLADPYAPTIAFDQRKTDTLFAIGKAWAALSH